MVRINTMDILLRLVRNNMFNSLSALSQIYYFCSVAPSVSHKIFLFFKFRNSSFHAKINSRPKVIEYNVNKTQVR